MAEPSAVVDVVSYDLPDTGITEEVAGYWCYAAAEQAIRVMMLSDAHAQEQIAHDFFLAFAAVGVKERATPPRSRATPPPCRRQPGREATRPMRRRCLPRTAPGHPQPAGQDPGRSADRR
jgi:hypothetical protein